MTGMKTKTPDSRELIAKIGDSKLSIDERISSIRTLMMANKDRMAQGVSSMLTPERVLQVACNSFRKNPALLECTVASLFSSISEAATYGWVIDGIMGDASLVPFNNRKKNCKEATMIPGYKGLRKLIDRAGECRVTMESVHEGDSFENLGRFQLPKHIPSNDPERKFKPVTHAYVVGLFNDGNALSFVWTVGECIAHRNQYSQNWRSHVEKCKKYPQYNKLADNPWSEENPAFRVMCMKTVLLDAIHRGEFPMSVEAQHIAARSYAAETGTLDTIQPMLLPDDRTLESTATHEDAPKAQPDAKPDDSPAATEKSASATGNPLDDAAEAIDNAVTRKSRQGVNLVLATYCGPDSTVACSPEEQAAIESWCKDALAKIGALREAADGELFPHGETAQSSGR